MKFSETVILEKLTVFRKKYKLDVDSEKTKSWMRQCATENSTRSFRSEKHLDEEIDIVCKIDAASERTE